MMLLIKEIRRSPPGMYRTRRKEWDKLSIKYQLVIAGFLPSTVWLGMLPVPVRIRDSSEHHRRIRHSTRQPATKIVRPSLFVEVSETHFVSKKPHLCSGYLSRTHLVWDFHPKWGSQGDQILRLPHSLKSHQILPATKSAIFLFRSFLFFSFLFFSFPFWSLLFWSIVVLLPLSFHGAFETA